MLCHMAEIRPTLLQKPFVECHLDSNHKATVHDATDLELTLVKNCIDSNNEDLLQNDASPKESSVKNYVAFNDEVLVSNSTGLEASAVKNGTNHVDPSIEDLVHNNIGSETFLLKNHVDSDRKDTAQASISLESILVDSNKDDFGQNATDPVSSIVENDVDSHCESAEPSDTGPESVLVENNIGIYHNNSRLTFVENHTDSNHKKLVPRSSSVQNCISSEQKDSIQNTTSLESITVKNHIDSNNEDLVQNSDLLLSSNQKDLVQNKVGPEASLVENRTDSKDAIHNGTSLQSISEENHVESSHKVIDLKIPNNLSKENGTKDDSKKFICKELKCTASFDTLEEKNSHVEKTHPNSKKSTHENQHGKLKQRCTFCNKAMNIAALQDHHKKCKKKRFCNLLECPIKDCSSKFGSFVSQQAHLCKKHHEPISCSYMHCEKTLKPSLLMTHMMNEHGHKNINSFEADPSNTEIRSRNSSITTNLQTPEIQDNQIIKKRRVGGSNRVPTIVCGIEGCTELFFKPSARTSHLIKRHPKPLPCPYKGCRLQLKPHLLEKHLVYEHGEFNPYLGKKMSLQSSKYAKVCHERAMKEGKLVKNFKCPDKTCSATFLDEVSRCEHVNKYHRKVPCPFEECDFASPSEELENHMRTQHAASSSLNDSEVDEFNLARRRRFLCLVLGCESIFSCGSSRTNHLEKQHNSTVKCPFSDCKACVPGGLLSAHMKIKHGDVRDEILEAQLLQAEEAKSATRMSLNKMKESPAKTDVTCQVVTTENDAVNFPVKTEKRVSFSVESPVTVDNVVNNSKTEKKASTNVKSPLADLDKMSKARLEKIFDVKELFESMKNDRNMPAGFEGTFKCYVRGCSSVFSTVRRRKDHVYKCHAVPFPCPYNNCKVSLTPARLQNHLKYLHNPLKLVLESKAMCTKVRLEYENRVKETAEEPEVTVDCMVKGCNSNFSSLHSRMTHYYKFHPDPVPCHFSGCDVSLKPVSLKVHIKKDHQHAWPNSGRAASNSSQKPVKCKKEPEETLPAKRAKIDEYEDQYVDIDKKYKCSFRDCPATFDTNRLRLDHEKVHLSLILCPHPDCKLVKRGNLELNDHVKYDHVDFKTSCFKCKKSYKWIKIREHIENCLAT